MKTLARCALLFAASVACAVQAQDARTIFDQVSPSVVTVRVYDAAGVADGEGSGVVIRKNEIITNCHVVDNAHAVRVVLRPRDERPATTTHRLAEADLCLLHVEDLPNPPVSVRASQDVVRGERVFAVGNPLGLGLAVSEGMSSAVMTFGGKPRILTSAPISPGSSGGGLFDAKGRLIGITTGILQLGQNVNVAVPADLISSLRSEGQSVAPAPPEHVKDVDWYAVAEKLRAERQWQALVDHSIRWLDAYPTSYLAGESLGYAQLNAGHATAARATLLALTAKFPSGARAFTYLGGAHRTLGELDLAEAAARRAIALRPGDGYGYSVLAEIQLTAGRLSDASESVATAIRLSPGLAYPWQARANIAAAAKRYPDAVSDMRVVARLMPGNLEVGRKLAAFLALAGQTGEARTLMAGIGAQQQSDALIWASIGRDESQRKRYSDAENAFRHAIEIDPGLIDGWKNLALLLRATDRHREGEEALRTVLKIDPADKWALALLADMVGTRGQAAEAKNLLEQATSGESVTATEWRALARSRSRERDLKGAADAYAKVVALDPKSVEDWIELGSARSMLREDAEATAALQAAARLDPDNERLLLASARFHGERGDFVKALELAERAVEKYPASADAWNNKGYSLLRLTQFKDAIGALTTAVRLDPDKAAPWVNLGEAYLRTGEMGRSIAALDRALKLAPKAADARLYITQAFASTGQYAIAQKHLDELLQLVPQLPAAWYLAGLLGAATNDQAVTLRAYEKLKVMNPQVAIALRKETEGKSHISFPD
jgi:tetratricopeptide (TPR) repeat protein